MTDQKTVIVKIKGKELTPEIMEVMENLSTKGIGTDKGMDLENLPADVQEWTIRLINSTLIKPEHTTKDPSEWPGTSSMKFLTVHGAIAAQKAATIFFKASSKEFSKHEPRYLVTEQKKVILVIV